MPDTKSWTRTPNSKGCLQILGFRHARVKMRAVRRMSADQSHDALIRLPELTKLVSDLRN